MKQLKKRILISWIGHPDLWQMQRETNDHLELVQKETHATEWKKSGSPVKELVSHETFDEVHLFSNYSSKANCIFQHWLGNRVTMHVAKLERPWNYSDAFHTTAKLFDDIAVKHADSQTEYHINLNAGTHAMVAVLLLLGSTKYSSIFYQVFQQKEETPSRPEVVDLPFDLSFVIRERFANEDQSWANIPFRSANEVSGFEDITGSSPGLLYAVHRARLAAIRNVNVLLLGDSGVGKELFARAIHNASGRKGKFIAVNCAAIPTELLEAELFGAVKNAGSNVAPRPGCFREADGGTLFLDEIGELMPGHQAKLLRAIESSRKGESPTKLRIEPVGRPGKPIVVDVRIVAATNRDLWARDGEHPFRRDLYYRLATFPVRIPALKDRKSDISRLIEILTKEIADEFSKSDPTFTSIKMSEAAVRRLRQHDWPGNIRELKWLLTRILVMWKKPKMDTSEIAEVGREIVDQELLQSETPQEMNAFAKLQEPNFNLKERLKQIEKEFLEKALEEAGGIQTKAAKILGITLSSLNKKIVRLNISIKRGG